MVATVLVYIFADLEAIDSEEIRGRKMHVVVGRISMMSLFGGGVAWESEEVLLGGRDCVLHCCCCDVFVRLKKQRLSWLG